MLKNSLVFVDSRVSNYQSLINSLAESAEVFVINGESDGLDQMVARLAGQTGIDAIHIISHGSQGALVLGSTVLDGGNLAAYGAQLADIGSALNAGGDILLYGCNVAAGDVGLQFVAALAQATGADVAASTDATGATALGGDWALERATGPIEASGLNGNSQDFTTLLAAPSFAAKVDYATGYGPTCVTSADVNGDGKADLIVANQGSDTVSVLTNNGNGTFAAKVDYAAGSGPFFVASADVNGDGKADLIVAKVGSNSVSVLTNNGNGTFAAQVDYATGDYPFDVTSADVNDDGKADLIVANGYSNTISVLTNNGDGTFAAKVDYATGYYPYSVTSADVNDDGKADLIVANASSNSISVLTNNGNGTFAAKVDYGMGSLPWSVTSADVNGDGKADLIVANSRSSTVSVLTNNGNGIFAAKVDYPTGSGPNSVTSADVNVDGKADLIVTNGSSKTVSVLTNNGNGTFAAKVDYATGSNPSRVTSADINGDGKADLIVTSYDSNTVSVLINTFATVAPTPTYSLKANAASYNEGTTAIFTLTTTGVADGKVMPYSLSGFGITALDVAGGTLSGNVTVSNNTATLSVLLAADATTEGNETLIATINGSTTSTTIVDTSMVASPSVSLFATKVDYATGSNPSSVTSADVNGDGKADLIVANSGSNTVSVLRNNGNGTFASKVNYATGPQPNFVTSTDVNGDGRADLIVSNNGNNTVSVLTNNGNGTFAAKVDYATGSWATNVISADINGDGNADLITSNTNDHTVSVLLNKGNGTFTAKADYATGTQPVSVISADVNGDGKADLITANWADGTVSVLTNNGNGSFAAKVDYATGLTPHSVTSADVNSDGKADLIVANSYSDTVSVLLNNGNGIFAAKVDYATGSKPWFVTNADVNGDGKADLIETNHWSHTISVLTNNGNGTFAAKVDYATGLTPSSVTSADINGDGKADLIVANSGSDTLSVLMNTFAPIPTYSLKTNAASYNEGTPAIFTLTTTGVADGKVMPYSLSGFGITALDVAGGTLSGNVTVNNNTATLTVLLAADATTEGNETLIATINGSTASTTIVDTSIVAPMSVSLFAAKVDYATGSNPSSVTSADVNGDGKADLIVANYGSNTVSVLMNNGNGTFAPKMNYATGPQPNFVTSTDVNGDGKADLILSNNGNNTVSVLTNNGNGTFAAKVDYATGSWATTVISADINGDGKADLITSNTNAHTVSVLLNKGNGTFTAKADYATGPQPVSVINADVNGDGKADLITANWADGTVSVLTNNGNGSFASKVDYAVGGYPHSVTSADVNGDGKADLIVAKVGSNSVSVLINNGNGTFAAKADYPTGNYPSSAFVTNADVNGDGKADLIVPNGDGNTVSVLTNNGNGTFAAEVDYATGLNPVSVTSADVNGDGKADLIVANSGSNTLSVLMNTFAPTPTYGLKPTAASYSEGSSAVFTVYTTNVPNGTVLAYTLGGIVNAADVTGGLTGNVTINNNTGTITVPLVADLTTEGAETLTATLAISPGSTASTTVNDTSTAQTPTFSLKANAASYNEGTPAIFTLTTTGVADGTELPYSLSGFGITALDVIGGALSGSVTVVNNTATLSVRLTSDATTEGIETLTATVNGSTASTTIVDTSIVAPMSVSLFAAKVDYATGSNPSSVTSADVNGDGKADLIVVNGGSNTVSVLTNNGNGTLAAKVDYATGSNPRYATSADVNGDGKADLIVLNGDSDTVSVLTNNGNGSFAAKVDYATGSRSMSVTSADVNGDGKADLIVTSYNSNTVSVLTNNGNGSFAAKVDYATGAEPVSVTSADVNGDGKADLIVANWSGTVSVLTNNGNGSFAAKVDYTIGWYAHSVTSADINGDGRADLIVAKIGDKNISVLTNNGNGTFAAQVEYVTSDYPWFDGLVDYPWIVTSADVNGDGKADLIVTNSGNNTVQVLLNNGNGTFAAKVDYATGLKPSSVTSADINGDGKADLIVANGGSNTLSVLMNTFATVAPAPTYSLAANAASYNEGSNAIFTLTTTGIANGTVLAYVMSGTLITAADLTGGSMAGNVTINNNTATITAALAADAITEGTETLTATITGTTATASTSVVDTSTGGTTPAPTYTVPGTLGNDFFIPSAGNNYLGGGGNDTYVISPFTLTGAVTAKITDTEGSNVIQWVDGMSISAATFYADAAQLTLSTGAMLQILGASRFSYQLGANAPAGDAATDQTYAQFAAALGGALPSGSTPVAITTGYVVPSGLSAAAAPVPATAGVSYTVPGTLGNDFFIPSGGNNYLGGGGNDTYIISPNTLSGAITAKISDTEGSNVVQWVDGMTISASLFYNDAVQLTLSTGAKVQILGASKFSFQLGANAPGNDSASSLTYAQFGTALGVSIPATGGAAVSGGANYVVPSSGSGATLVDLSSGTVTAGSAAEEFRYDFQLVGGRVTKAGDGEVSINGFNVTQDKLVFVNTTNATTYTEAQFKLLPGVSILADPFGNSTSLYLDPLAGVPGSVTLTGIADAGLDQIVLETL